MRGPAWALRKLGPICPGPGQDEQPGRGRRKGSALGGLGAGGAGSRRVGRTVEWPSSQAKPLAACSPSPGVGPSWGPRPQGPLLPSPHPQGPSLSPRGTRTVRRPSRSLPKHMPPGPAVGRPFTKPVGRWPPTDPPDCCSTSSQVLREGPFHHSLPKGGSPTVLPLCQPCQPGPHCVLLDGTGTQLER